MKTGIQVAEAMTEQPVTVGPNTTVQQCAKIMTEMHVGALVVKQEHKLVGVLTEQDIVRKAVLNNQKPSSLKAKEIMETKVITITPEKDIFDAIQLLKDYNIRHLPVVEEDRLVGLITGKDILKIQPELFEILAEKIELKEQERKPIKVPKKKEGICQGCGRYSENIAIIDSQMLCENCRE